MPQTATQRAETELLRTRGTIMHGCAAAPRQRRLLPQGQTSFIGLAVGCGRKAKNVAKAAAPTGLPWSTAPCVTARSAASPHGLHEFVPDRTRAPRPDRDGSGS